MPITNVLSRIASACAIGSAVIAAWIPSVAHAAPQSPTDAPAYAPVRAGTTPRYGPNLEGFPYPYPVKQFAFESQREALHMAYMDVAAAPGTANGRTAVLLHGKNFCAATWDPTIDFLSAHGFRVIAVDQIGFCKSSKPDGYQYSFQALARNTHALLEQIHIAQPILIGHSTGGMLAIRYALMYPTGVQQLVLIDPIGLEDWKAKGVPSIGVDQWYARELGTNADKIRRYEQSTYYGGEWRADYEPWVQMLAGMNRGPGKARVAWNSAKLYDMIYTQPVYYELKDVSPPTLLFVGDKDTTAIGKDLAPPEIQKRLGDYPVLGRQAAALIPHATLVEFAWAGHAPQMQDPPLFHAALLKGLQTSP